MHRARHPRLPWSVFLSPTSVPNRSRFPIGGPYFGWISPPAPPRVRPARYGSAFENEVELQTSVSINVKQSRPVVKPSRPDVKQSRPAARRSTQRERLIAGMIAVAHRHGYAGANVSEVIAHAGVSRPTFYEYFTDKDDCFLAAHRELSGLLIEEIRLAVTAEAPEQAVQAAIRKLIELSERYPDRAGFLTNQAMAGGWRGLDERDRLIGMIAQIVEHARAGAPARALSPDLPALLVLGAGRWLLAPPLRRGERDLSGLRDEIIDWVERYQAPHREHRWHGLNPGPPLPASPHVSQISLRPPAAIPPGRSKLSKAEIIRNQRERIVYATAKVATIKGYTVATIADITAAAHVDRRVFYRHFPDKQQAFLAVHELCVQQLMAVTASAFFSAPQWPERAWEAMRACTQFQAHHSVLTHIALVESHAVGAAAIQRIDDSRAAFTIFCHEGNHYTSRTVSRTAMEAILAAIFEIFYRQARRRESDQMSRFTPNGAYIQLAPFLGPAAANEFIDERLRAVGRVR
jgi:AcrR family transcriptional regulator